MNFNANIPNTDKPSDLRIIRMSELTGILGVSRSTILRWQKDKTFPKSVKLGERAVGWAKSDIEVWVNRKRLIKHILPTINNTN